MLKLNLNNNRIDEAIKRRSAYYKGDAVDHMPYIFYIDAPIWHGWMGGNPYDFDEMIQDSQKAVDGQIMSLNWQSENFPDSDWIPFFKTCMYGEGYVPSMFGATQLIAKDCPPFTEGRILNSIYDVEKLPERINPSKDGWGPMVREAMLKMVDAGGGKIPIAITDHQSPYGIATKLINNEDLILAMYDEPELVHKLLDISTNALIDVVKETQKWVGKDLLALNEANPIPQESGIILWDDFVSVLSPDLYIEFCLPYNQRVYNQFGRGHFHTCGPYFSGFMEACLANNPSSMDASIMRGTGKSKEDLLLFRKITKENGIIIIGNISSTSQSVFDGDSWEHCDEDFLRQMADGGLVWCEGGSFEKGMKCKDMAEKIL